jgi:sigma-B regulation protein RsbU (phosphoserine phosphatase)
MTPHSRPALAAPSIWVVDPDPDAGAILQALLADGDLGAVRTLRSAAEYWPALIAAGADPARSLPLLLLLAERGPDFDGVAVCRDTRQRPGLADLPVILLTSRSDHALLDRAYQAGVNDHFDKPILREELLLRVRSALRLAEETRIRKQREAELSETAARLKASLDRVAADLAAAARLQRSLLPPAPATLRGVSYDWRFLPSEALGGDLLGVLPLPDGGIALYLLDVSGHGVQAALFSVALHRLLTTAPGGLLLDAEGQVRDPAAVVRQLNAQFQMGGEELVYFTLVLAHWQPATGTLSHVQAGHPGMLLLLPDGSRQILPEGALPVGMMPGVRYQTSRVTLPPGTRLLLYSDGVTEAGAASESMVLYGSEQLLAQISRAPLGECLDAIVADVAAWAGPEGLGDDASLLLLDLLPPPADPEPSP